MFLFSHFYDYYNYNDILNGISLFDVSGHGLSASLVTMLSDTESDYKPYVKKFLKLAYVLSTYDLVFNDQTQDDFLPFRMIVTKEFKETYDSDGANKKALAAMCEEFRAKFRERLKTNTWMSASSKAAADEKAEKNALYCGLPRYYSRHAAFNGLQPFCNHIPSRMRRIVQREHQTILRNGKNRRFGKML